MSAASTATAVIASTAWNTWRGDLARSLHWSTWSVRLAIWVSGAVAALASIGLCWLVLYVFGDLRPQAGTDLRPYVCLGLSGVLLAAVIVNSLNAAISPSTDVLRGVLRRLPVSTSSISLGLMQPVLAVGNFIAICLAAPSITMVGYVVASTGLSTAAVGMGVGLLVISGLGVIGSIRVLCWLMTAVLRLPRMYGTAIASLLTLIVGVLLAVPGLGLIPPSGVGVYVPGSLLSELLFDPAAGGFISWALLGVWAVAACALFVLGLRLREIGDGQPATRLLVGVGLPRGQFAAYIVGSLLVVVRLPQYIVLSLLALLGILSTWGAMRSDLPGLQLYAAALVPTFIAVPWAIGMYAFGSLRWFHSRTRLTPARCGGNALATYIATLLAGLPMALVVILTGALTGQIGFPQIAEGLAAGLALSITTTFMGSLVPFTAQQPLSATVTSVAALGVYAVATLLIGWLANELGITSTAIASLAVAGFAAVGGLFWSREVNEGAIGH